LAKAAFKTYPYNKLPDWHSHTGDNSPRWAPIMCVLTEWMAHMPQLLWGKQDHSMSELQRLKRCVGTLCSEGKLRPREVPRVRQLMMKQLDPPAQLRAFLILCDSLHFLYCFLGFSFSLSFFPSILMTPFFSVSL
jgi:hypothetical protein